MVRRRDIRERLRTLAPSLEGLIPIHQARQILPQLRPIHPPLRRRDLPADLQAICAAEWSKVLTALGYRAS